ETKGGKQNAQTTIDGNVLRAAIARLNQPEPGLGNVGRRQRQSAAQRIEGLLHAFANGGSYRGFGPLPADFAETRSEHGGRHNRGRSKSEDDHHDGEENDNREYERQRHKSVLSSRFSVLSKNQNLNLSSQFSVKTYGSPGFLRTENRELRSASSNCIFKLES